MPHRWYKRIHFSNRRRATVRRVMFDVSRVNIASLLPGSARTAERHQTVVSACAKPPHLQNIIGTTLLEHRQQSDRALQPDGSAWMRSLPRSRLALQSDGRFGCYQMFLGRARGVWQNHRIAAWWNAGSFDHRRPTSNG